MKKILYIAMIFFVTTAMLAGCSSKSENMATQGDKMKIKWMGIPNFATGKVGSFPQKLIEEKFNVKIEPVFLDAQGYSQKKPLMFSMGDISDLIYLLDPSAIQGDVKQGFLAEVSFETIKKYAPTLYGIINRETPDIWAQSNYNGKNYAVPNGWTTDNNTRLGLWRLDWLKNTGINKVPETLDEFYQAFYNFRYKDPDRNGKDDTYALSGDIISYYMSFNEIYGAFGVMPCLWREKDGEIVYGGLEPEVKEALTTLANWYKEGLISPDFITDRYGSSISDKFNSGKIGYMNHFGSDSSYDDITLANSRISQVRKKFPNAELAIATPPKGSKGAQGTFSWGLTSHFIGFGRHLKEQPHKMQKILEIMDYLVKDSEFSIKLKIGEKGTHWDYKDVAKGPSSGIKMLSPYDDRSTALNDCLSTGIYSISFFGMMPLRNEISAQFVTERDKAFRDKYWQVKLGVSDVFSKPDSVPQASKYLGDLQNKQLTAMGQIIRGEKDVSSYDEFIKLWHSNGGDILTSEANKLYKERKNIRPQ